MKIPVRLFLVVSFALLALSACQTAAVQPEQVMTLEEFFAPASGKVQSTADNILVTGVRTKFVKGHLKADFKLLNNRGRRNVINYRVQWLDKEGMMASPYAEWLTTSLEGQQEMIITVMSPNTRAIDYRLELQTN
ncbi:MAG: YcfL family protein [Desulfuromonadales bacterium]